MRHGVARRVRVEREAGRVGAIAADRRLDPAGARRRLAADERQVGALEGAAANERREPLVRLLGAGDDHEPRRVAVEAVDDPRAALLTACDQAGELVDERAGGATGTRMDDEARRLVDDGEMLVLPGDAHRRPVPGRGGGLLGRGRELDPFAAFEPVAPGPAATVDERPARRPPAPPPRATRASSRGTGRASPPRPRPERPQPLGASLPRVTVSRHLRRDGASSIALEGGGNATPPLLGGGSERDGVFARSRRRLSGRRRPGGGGRPWGAGRRRGARRAGSRRR